MGPSPTTWAFPIALLSTISNVGVQQGRQSAQLLQEPVLAGKQDLKQVSRLNRAVRSTKAKRRPQPQPVRRSAYGKDLAQGRSRRCLGGARGVPSALRRMHEMP